MDPLVASYLFVGWIFLIIGLDNNFAFILMGVLFIFLGIGENNKSKT